MSHANPGCDDGGMGDFPCYGCRITLYRLSAMKYLVRGVIGQG